MAASSFEIKPVHVNLSKNASMIINDKGAIYSCGRNWGGSDQATYTHLPLPQTKDKKDRTCIKMASAPNADSCFRTTILSSIQVLAPNSCRCQRIATKKSGSNWSSPKNKRKKTLRTKLLLIWLAAIITVCLLLARATCMLWVSSSGTNFSRK